MKSKRAWWVVGAVILISACLVGVMLGITSSGAAWLYFLRRPTAVSQGVTQIAATPVRPALTVSPRPATLTSSGLETLAPLQTTVLANTTTAGINTTPALRVTPTVPGTPTIPGSPVFPGVTTGTPARTPTLPSGLLRTPSPFPAGTGTGVAATQPISSSLAYSLLANDPSCIPQNSASAYATVTRVIDGVTIEVNENGKVYEVRYIGVDLPDYSQDYTVWTRATAKNEELVGGQQVLLISEWTDQDEFGRRLRYVLAGGVFVNYEMIYSGYAIEKDEPPNIACSRYLLAAEQQAVARKIGLWVPQPTATRNLIPTPTSTVAITGLMAITHISWRGTIWQEPEEYVEFRNDSTASINLEGWTLQDNERHIFNFPQFILGPGQYCRVYTNAYHPASCGFSYWSQSPIWNNDTDCAYLKNPYGELISKMCYGFQ